jgi:tRNA pseudouridine38-40 synthase
MSSRTVEKRRPAPEELRRLALLVEYEGTAYHGFQSQSNAASVQATLEEALHSLTGEQRRIQGAGRTDAGVHAEGQVVAFDTWAPYDPGVFVQGLNHYLPEDVSVKEAREVSLDFDPRRWAVSREYRYQILNSATSSPLLRRHAHLVRKPLDTAAMQEAARFLEGERDFAPFSGPLDTGRRGTRRRMFRCLVIRNADLVTLEMVANGFLRQQVRRTAGALVEVGLGRLDLRRFVALAECGVQGAAHTVLPAKGLSLMKVSYPDSLIVSGEIFSSGQRRETLENTLLEAVGK